MRLRTRFTAVVAAMVAALTMMIAPASAAVSFDANTGVGFVGKGDVQTSLGLNNAQLQKTAAVFAYEQTTDYAVTCVWTTGAGTRGEKTHRVTQNKTTAVNAGVVSDHRVKNQITGYNLTGFDQTVVAGDAVPGVGDPCLGGGVNGTVESAVVTEVAGGLTVNGVLLS